jgi:hypothetical protein
MTIEHRQGVVVFALIVALHGSASAMRTRLS